MNEQSLLIDLGGRKLVTRLRKARIAMPIQKQIALSVFLLLYP